MHGGWGKPGVLLFGDKPAKWILGRRRVSRSLLRGPDEHPQRCMIQHLPKDMIGPVVGGDEITLAAGVPIRRRNGGSEEYSIFALFVATTPGT